LPAGGREGKAFAVDRVTIDIDGGVADVRLNRPDKRNALDGAMFDALFEAGEALAANPSVRAVVLSGEGQAFCAGLDFSSFQAMAGDGDTTPEPERNNVSRLVDRGDRITNRAQQVAWVWTELPVPVIAAVHGACLGGGLQIALGADLRIVSPDAQLSVLEIRWGLIPDMTGTWQLPRLVGLDVAKDLTFTGRMVGGEEAVRIGLATRLADDARKEALALAAELTTKNPNALRGAKALLNQSGSVSVHEQFLNETATISTLIGTPNQVEAVMAFFEKRPPAFAERDQ
jgi:enoyl-CoA hydratase/carnithine racemase